ncbi:MAG TPA: alanine--tRNA ligase [Chthoniobacterales bacterium]|nr:alanine--tRNA ligase [Chthoniobacterales bacterium]
MTAAEIRQSFFDFFREKEHTIVPSASLMPDSPNLLFTNAGMNQFVPIFLGQQKPAWNPARAADTQKCIRAGGKHNDLDDVGLDTYHHTFFEMLGNWSFGDYFKREAIEWAWELVVEQWKLPPSRLYATVYKPGPGEPSEFDQEAYDHWERMFRKARLDPAVHIVNGNKKDNFWMMGDTGPCGPCSELHVDLTPAGDTKGSLVNVGDARCIEIWNLVFIQFNANPDGTFSPLPQRHVDTGMGLERITAMIQGTKNFTDFSGVVSNYETDVFRPIFDELQKLSGKKYTSTLPGGYASSMSRPAGFQPAEDNDRQDAGRPSQAGSPTSERQEQIDIAFRVIADHIRTLSFAIADGIQPGNEGRGYVLRRILRRAVRYGRTLGFHEPFFFNLTDVLVRAMADVFPELRKQYQQIKDTLRREEEGFNKTLDKGIGLFESEVARSGSGTISGDFAFRLYDEQGFPLDLTELMARERGLDVDRAGFERLMEEQRSRARSAQKKTSITLAETDETIATNFLGYEHDHTGADVISVTPADGLPAVVLNNSVCYAEMGGQVGDRGTIAADGRLWKIANTQKAGATYIHLLEEGEAPDPGAHVTVTVDVPRRRAIERHHTVTHLLHWALHEKVSREASQKGSYVGPEKLTFDFSSSALTAEQKRAVEELVNEKVTENATVSWTEIAYTDAKKRSDIQQFFGDKYGDTVRVVQIGGEPGTLNGYSMELCGGTHVRQTADIGSFRIVREEAIAAGIRRIEAVAGEAAQEWARTEAHRQEEKFAGLARKKAGITVLPSFSISADAATMLKEIDERAAHLQRIEVEVQEWQKQQGKASEAEMKNRAGSVAKELRVAHEGDKSIVASVAEADSKMLQSVIDTLRSHFNGPIFLASAFDGRVSLIASVPKEMTTQFQANKLIQEIAPIVGGKGGGRPDNAQGAGKDPSKIDAALAKARDLLQ